VCVCVSVCVKERGGVDVFTIKSVILTI
jgi:hypothetical protein